MWSHQAKAVTWVHAIFSGTVQSASSVHQQIAHFHFKLHTPKWPLLLGGSTKCALMVNDGLGSIPQCSYSFHFAHFFAYIPLLIQSLKISLITVKPLFFVGFYFLRISHCFQNPRTIAKYTYYNYSRKNAPTANIGSRGIFSGGQPWKKGFFLFYSIFAICRKTRK